MLGDDSDGQPDEEAGIGRESFPDSAVDYIKRQRSPEGGRTPTAACNMGRVCP